ncbi:hypothetical protein [Actinomadura monticuli]|uniref:Uncharacterized protein n=1 Tax=Actinomadura monticuli TaxID=3097367 RepID=A0ABV4QBA2_9ACTN
MRPCSTILATAALAASVMFAVPPAAHADVTDLKVTTAFDRLDPDRVATVTVTAKSASGVTDVRANVRHPNSRADVYATLEFERVAGTDKDGTWRATFHPDVETRPGNNSVEVLVESADGATAKGYTDFRDCYQTTITDVTTGPDVIDADHPEVDVHGKVMVQKSRDVAPAPVPSAAVQGGGKAVTTAADGSFGLALNGMDPLYVRFPRQGTLCEAGTYGSTPTIAKQATQTSAWVQTLMPVAIGTGMTVEGKVLRRGAAGLVPAGDVTVEGYLNYGKPEQKLLARGYTLKDGTFQLKPAPDRSGPFTVVAGDTAFLMGSHASAGTLDVRRPVAFADINVEPEPGGYGDPLGVTGHLVSDLNGLAQARVIMEFSADGKTWRTMATQNTYSDGWFHLTTDDSKKDGYWRARYAGDSEYMPVVSGTHYIDIKYRTHIYHYNASPEPVKKGGTITVKGLLYRFRDVAGAGPNANIHIYFKPKGSSTWTKMAITKTGSDGWFKKTFTASQDGTWLARYWESAGYLGSNAPSDYVDVT